MGSKQNALPNVKRFTVTYDMMDTKVSYAQNRANLPYSRSD